MEAVTLKAIDVTLDTYFCERLDGINRNRQAWTMAAQFLRPRKMIELEALVTQISQKIHTHGVKVKSCGIIVKEFICSVIEKN